MCTKKPKRLSLVLLPKSCVVDESTQQNTHPNIYCEETPIDDINPNFKNTLRKMGLLRVPIDEAALSRNLKKSPKTCLDLENNRQKPNNHITPYDSIECPKVGYSEDANTYFIDIIYPHICGKYIQQITGAEFGNRYHNKDIKSLAINDNEGMYILELSPYYGKIPLNNSPLSSSVFDFECRHIISSTLLNKELNNEIFNIHT